MNVLPKPTLVAQTRIEKLDTNKLPKLNELLVKKIEKVEELSKIHETTPDAAPTGGHAPVAPELAGNARRLMRSSASPAAT